MTGQGPQRPPEADDAASETEPPASTTWFQHDSEREFARLLDFYRVPWEYEPRTFVFATDAKGNPTAAFAPDFYLPDEDLYIELTTMEQRLVRRKRRKLRRLAEAFPEVQCKLFYQRDVRALLVKYGLVPDAGTSA